MIHGIFLQTTRTKYIVAQFYKKSILKKKNREQLLSKLSAIENVELPLIYRGLSQSERIVKLNNTAKKQLELLKKDSLNYFY